MTRVIIYHAPGISSSPAFPKGCTLVRINRESPIAGHAAAERVMQDANEPKGVAQHRFAHGDELFGWMVDGMIISFGWVTHGNRKIGPVCLAEIAGRVCLYNFHTLSGYRGLGLYPSLLLAIRHLLGCEKVTEFIIDVNVQRTPSMKGVLKAGFVPVVRLVFITFFRKCDVLIAVTPRKSNIL